MTASDLSTAIGAAAASIGFGSIGLLYFFVKQYFTTRDKKQISTEKQLVTNNEIVTAVRIEMAGFSTRLDCIDNGLDIIKGDLNFITTKQLPRIFDYIDAPKRATDSVSS